MKLALLTTFSFPLVPAAAGENYLRKVVDDLLGAEQVVADETTRCTYYWAHNDEGCAADDMCKIGVGKCLLYIAQQEGVCYTPSPVCTEDYNPVCGCDGVTYGNECSALGAGVNIQNVGCCPDDEECKASMEPEKPAPVETTPCTYYSVNKDEGCATGDMCKIGTGKCRLRMAWQEGVCYTPSPVCTTDFDPVCGCDFKTYANECSALAAGVNIQNVGCCPGDEECEDSMEPDQPAPVKTTRCTYYGINDDEGCATDDMCKIGTGKCMLKIAQQDGVCYTPSSVCTMDYNPVCGCDGVTYSNECSALAAGVNVQNVGCCPDDEKCKDSMEPDQPAPVETTKCTYYSINNDEGCATDDMCKIETGKCMLKIAQQDGVCYTPSPVCTMDYNPVCGCDGVTYSNECSALGAGVNVLNVGCCPGDEECEDSTGPDRPAPVETTPCTYYGVNDEEGCATDDMCKIGIGKCVLKIAQQDGVCYTPSPACFYDWNPVCGCDGVTYSNECSALGAGVNIQSTGCCPDDEECEDSM